METSGKSLLQLLKDKANIISAKSEEFQAEIKCLMDKMMQSNTGNISMYNDKLNILCADYSTSINRLEIEYLMKCEQHLQNENTSSDDVKAPYRCDKCDLSYTAKSSFRRHNRKNHADDTDDEGPVDSDESSNLESSQESNERRHECQYCDKTYTALSCLTRHVREQHSNFLKTKRKDDRPFKCTYCVSDFADIRYLRQHIYKVHGENPWECDECEAKFRLKRMLKKHKESTHPNNSD
eukprot:UN12151